MGRAVPTGPGRRLGEPFDLAGALEAALSGQAFDVVHLHEPLAPSPALAALRHASGVTAGDVPPGRAARRGRVPAAARSTARSRAPACASRTSDAARRALADILPGDYTLVAPGVDAAALAPPPRARAGRRAWCWSHGVATASACASPSGCCAGLDLSALGPVTLLGPADAPWRTRAAVPKALRGTVTVVPDEGPEARAHALASAGIAVHRRPDRRRRARCSPRHRRRAAPCWRRGARPPTRTSSTASTASCCRPSPARPGSPRSPSSWPARRVARACRPPRGRARASWDDEAADLEREYRRALADGAARPAGARVLRRPARAHGARPRARAAHGGLPARAASTSWRWPRRRGSPRRSPRATPRRRTWP